MLVQNGFPVVMLPAKTDGNTADTPTLNKSSPT